MNPDTLAVHKTSKTAEHYTPDHIIDAVIRVLGTISLDPCSNSQEDPNVPALFYYTKEDDGLAQEWHGNIYMNPPYGRDIGFWVGKLVEQYEKAGNISAAIALVPARTDTQWWQQLRDAHICFLRGRLTFKGNDAGAPFPSAVACLGPWPVRERFIDVFSEYGDIWERLIKLSAD